MICVFFPRIVAPGDVLHGSSGDEDALEADRVPPGETRVRASRSVTRSVFYVHMEISHLTCIPPHPPRPRRGRTRG